MRRVIKLLVLVSSGTTLIINTSLHVHFSLGLCILILLSSKVLGKYTRMLGYSLGGRGGRPLISHDLLPDDTRLHAKFQPSSSKTVAGYKGQATGQTAFLVRDLYIVRSSNCNLSRRLEDAPIL